LIATLRWDAVSHIRSWQTTSIKPVWLLWFRLFLLTPGFQLVFWMRVQRAITRLPLIGPALRRVVWYWTTIVFGCDIDPQAAIGRGLYLPHPTGIVIGGQVRIGKSVTIQQNVTLGRVKREIGDDPIIEDNVEIGAGAVILGAITIGAGAKIGANSVVLNDIPAGAVAVGAPARVLARASVELLPENTV
jgi:serine O-acetyltransferase